jgi:hypothetical protein
MTDMKCPICGNDLEQYHSGLVCYRHCLNGKNVWGGEETLKELDRTRKALELAKDTLCWYDVNYGSVVARNTLDEIKTITKGGDNE